jgi:hypothetical protein
MRISSNATGTYSRRRWLEKYKVALSRPFQRSTSAGFDDFGYQRTWHQGPYTGSSVAARQLSAAPALCNVLCSIRPETMRAPVPSDWQTAPAPKPRLAASHADREQTATSVERGRGHPGSDLATGSFCCCPKGLRPSGPGRPFSPPP